MNFNDLKNEASSMRDAVLARIETRNVRMRSRAFFALKIVGIAVLGFAVFVVSILIGNFISFTLRLNGQSMLLNGGFHGWLLFVQLFPWPLLVLDVVLIVLLELLLRQFRFGYRSPVLYIFLGLILISAAGGVALDRGTPFNDELLHQADRGHLPPPLNLLYRGSRHTPPPGSGFYRGTVVSFTATTTTILDPDRDSALTVLLPQNGPSAHVPLSVGETVVVICGPDHNGIEQAIDIHPVDAYDIPPRQNDGPDPDVWH